MEMADGSAVNTLPVRSGHPAIHELWRHQYVGRFKVDKQWTERMQFHSNHVIHLLTSCAPLQIPRKLPHSVSMYAIWLIPFRRRTRRVVRTPSFIDTRGQSHSASTASTIYLDTHVSPASRLSM